MLRIDTRRSTRKFAWLAQSGKRSQCNFCAICTRSWGNPVTPAGTRSRSPQRQQEHTIDTHTHTPPHSPTDRKSILTAIWRGSRRMCMSVSRDWIWGCLFNFPHCKWWKSIECAAMPSPATPCRGFRHFGAHCRNIYTMQRLTSCGAEWNGSAAQDPRMMPLPLPMATMSRDRWWGDGVGGRDREWYALVQIAI